MYYALHGNQNTKKTSRQDLAQIDRGFLDFFLLFSSRTIVRQALVSVFASARDQIHMELKVLVLVSSKHRIVFSRACVFLLSF